MQLNSEPQIVSYTPKRVKFFAYLIGAVVSSCAFILAIVMVLIGGHFSNFFGFAAVGMVIFWICYRQASVRIDILPTGLKVRNLFSTKTVNWEEIEKLSFPSGDAWPHLELYNYDPISLMALQRIDGESALAEAQALADTIRVRKALAKKSG